MNTCDQQRPRMGVPQISVLIKALNEEVKIAACIESVIASLEECGRSFEVVLADSGSSDRTIVVAAAYDVKIVQLELAHDRGCGAGVQLGFQHSLGQYVLFLDGDMALQSGFLQAALTVMEADPKLGGVAGLMREAAIRNVFDATRVAKKAASEARLEKWLNGGGLYRRDAILQAGGYAGHQGLKAWEEAELGMRLRAAGWHLRRINVESVVHDGHTLPTASMLLALWRNGRAFAGGALLRGSFGRPWFREVMLLLRHPLGVIGWWGAVPLLAVAESFSGLPLLLIWCVFALLGVVALLLKKKGLKATGMSLLLWHFWAAGLLLGLFHKVPDPLRELPSKLIRAPGS